MADSPHISVVTPVYGCAASLEKLYERLKKTLSEISERFEIIMVDDASPDGAWEKISALAVRDSRVKGIRLSRNFGQHRAITAGLDYAEGEWVVVMDCDLQDVPEEITKLYAKALEGYDVVFARRAVRRDNWIKKMSSKIFHIVFNYLTDSSKDEAVANFSIVHRRVVRQLRRFEEQNRTYPFFVDWIGFRQTAIDVRHAERLEGKSSYSFKKLLDLAIDNIVSQSNKPLRLSIKFGFVISAVSIFYAIYLIIRYITEGIAVAGWTSVMVSIFFIGGLLFANLGFVGLYIGKIFDETKRKPLYIIAEKTNQGTKYSD